MRLMSDMRLDVWRHVGRGRQASNQARRDELERWVCYEAAGVELTLGNDPGTGGGADVAEWDRRQRREAEIETLRRQKEEELAALSAAQAR